MITVSDAWKEKHKELILPETFVEISCALTELGVQEEATASGTDEAIISDISGVTGTSSNETTTRYATFEPNFWLLDGSFSAFPDVPNGNSGYASNTAGSGSVTLTLPKVHTAVIPGVTITWSSKFDEYATDFTVTAKNGDSIVAEMRVTDNKSNRSLVYLEIANYDSVTVTVNAWSLPYRRSRIDFVYLGLDMTFTKNDILSYTHEQSGCVFSGELPKNSIEFSVDNSDNRWNPNNPIGLERYLSERQRLTVRYGMDIDGAIEWIRAGTFYLSEWKAASNGLEASFMARDSLEFMLNTPYTGVSKDTKVSRIIASAIEQADLPDEIVPIYEIFGDDWYCRDIGGEYSIAEVLQLCANALGRGLYQASDGKLYIKEKNDFSDLDYVIDAKKLYAWPEIELFKTLKDISVSYNDGLGGSEGGKYILSVNANGETQTVANPMISSESHADYIAQTVRRWINARNTVSGEFRADPRLELFDFIEIDTKFGRVPLLITNIKYSYNGAFRGSYVGREIKAVG